MKRRFPEILASAIRDMADHGFDSIQRIDSWIGELRRAAVRDVPNALMLDRVFRQYLHALYERHLERDRIGSLHQVARVDIDSIAPQLRAELERRILTSADLIRLNREQAIGETLKRFQGWATSLPSGPAGVKLRKTAGEIAKPFKSRPFEERRVLIDQGHKLIASVDSIVAAQNRAIAAVWRSHWRQAGYDYRSEHKAIDGHVYAVRDSWAMDEGFMKKGHGYIDELTEQPAQAPFCRCWFRWIYALRDLPETMLTEKGRSQLAKTRVR